VFGGMLVTFTHKAGSNANLCCLSNEAFSSK
jgi:hypothetical protein